jgi:hypothetical protein
LVSTNEEFNRLNLQYTFDAETVSDKVYHSLVESLYPTNRRQPIVFDKHRGWPKHVESIRQYVDPEPKIIATVRPIAEILASYITLADKDENNFIDRHLRELEVEITNESRAMLLWERYLNTEDGNGPYQILKVGYETHPVSILLVDYDALCYEPRLVMQNIYDFCGMRPFEHDFKMIEGTCEEAKDEAWGMKGLHDIRSSLIKRSVDPLAYLPRDAINWFSQFDIGVTHGY